MSILPETISADSVDEAELIAERKRSHFDLCAHHEVEFRQKTTLLEDIELIHQPVTETLLEDIDLGTEMLGKQLCAPVIITGMSGGTEETGRFNREMAVIAEKFGVGFGVGSQRVMLRQPEFSRSFQVRDCAPNVLLLGNIGIAQARELTNGEIRKLMDDIQADAICLHLNTAMEIVQHHGDHDFRGSLEAIRRLTEEFGERLIVKETGCGFARETGVKLAEAGVKWIDVAGAGGTSWVKVETLRHRALRQVGETFSEWGIPTAASICELRDLNVHLIASGGIRNGLQAAKAIAIGAQIAGIALPMMRAWVMGGIAGAESFLSSFLMELRAAVMLCGCEHLADPGLRQAIIRGRLLEWCRQRNLRL
jgi:isopentenyl-diphosphate delta-isomerase